MTGDRSATLAASLPHAGSLPLQQLTPILADLRGLAALALVLVLVFAVVVVFGARLIGPRFVRPLFIGQGRMGEPDDRRLHVMLCVADVARHAQQPG